MVEWNTLITWLLAVCIVAFTGVTDHDLFFAIAALLLFLCMMFRKWRATDTYVVVRYLKGNDAQWGKPVRYYFTEYAAAKAYFNRSETTYNNEREQLAQHSLCVIKRVGGRMHEVMLHRTGDTGDDISTARRMKNILTLLNVKVRLSISPTTLPPRRFSTTRRPMPQGARYSALAGFTKATAAKIYCTTSPNETESVGVAEFKIFGKFPCPCVIKGLRLP